MVMPSFVAALRAAVGHRTLWLVSATAVIFGPSDDPSQRNVLLVRDIESGLWSPVTGIVEPGEEPDTTVIREVREEAGLDIRVNRLLRVAATAPVRYPNGDCAQYLDHSFECTIIGGEPHADFDETDAVGWFPLGRLPPMHQELKKRLGAVEAQTEHVHFGDSRVYRCGD